MANPGTLNGGAATSDRPPAKNGQPTMVVPFVRASALRREQPFVDRTQAITTADQDLGSFDIPAYGFLRSLLVIVTATGGAGVAAVAHEDAPFSVLKNILLTEPNGAVIAQFNSGYSLFLANKYGGYRFAQDPRAYTDTGLYQGVQTNGNFACAYRIPVELNTRDALGSLPNQNAAATFKLRLTINSGATGGTLYSTQPTGFPNLSVKVIPEYWDQPPQSIDGAAAAALPPALSTTQFWTEQQFSVNAGSFNVRLTRMGNYIRNLIFCYRRAGTSRSNGEADWPDPTYLYVDIHQQDSLLKSVWKQQIYERYGYGTAALEAAGGRDNGVYPYDFCHEFDGKVGHENRDLWLPTKASSRVEIQGTFGNAGTLTVLTNDVATVGNVFM